MQPTHLICHYAEIGLKGKNRKYFENRLKNNMKYQLRNHYPGLIENIKHLQGRFLMKISDSSKEAVSNALSVLTNVFGIAYIAPAIKVDHDLDIFKATALQVLTNKEFDTFRISARKSGYNIPFSKQMLHNEIGTHIVNRLNKKVNLGAPDATCYIDLLQDSAFIYTEKISGPGGLPVGSSGKVIIMISGGIDSPIAAYYVLKRGASPVYVHFHSVPYTTSASLEKVRTTVSMLNKYHPNSKLYMVEFAPIQDEIFKNADPKLRIVLYRRFMLRISEAIAEKENAKAIITGEALGQVASQTLENMGVIQMAVVLPVLRPLIGFDKQEIINKAIEIGTYEISIQPHQDCCTLFIPKHPATKARLIDVDLAETKLNVDQLVSQAVETSTVEIAGNG